MNVVPLWFVADACAADRCMHADELAGAASGDSDPDDVVMVDDAPEATTSTGRRATIRVEGGRKGGRGHGRGRGLRKSGGLIKRACTMKLSGAHWDKQRHGPYTKGLHCSNLWFPDVLGSVAT